jgi:hypothetical protein
LLIEIKAFCGVQHWLLQNRFGGYAMNASVYDASLTTHVKIVCVALIGAIFIAAMGIGAHFGI